MGKITLFESSSLAHRYEPQRVFASLLGPFGPTHCAEALPSPSDHTHCVVGSASFAWEPSVPVNASVALDRPGGDPTVGP